jgi:type I restriction enzyme S subunit
VNTVKKLWEVTAWNKRFKTVDTGNQTKIIKYPIVYAHMLKQMNVKNGDVFLLSTGTFKGWTTREKAAQYLCSGEVAVIAGAIRANVRYFKGEFVTSNNVLGVSLDSSILLTKYLYYYMLSNSDLIQSYYIGSGITCPDMSQILDMDIILPPLEVQQRIVTILDKFDTLATNVSQGLQAELAARCKQYEYYCKHLLTFKGVI